MEKELNIIPPIGYEIDRQKSTFEKIIFKKIPENPKTWEDYCSLMEGKKVYHTDFYYIIIRSFQNAHNMFATKEPTTNPASISRLYLYFKTLSKNKLIYTSYNKCLTIYMSHFL